MHSPDPSPRKKATTLRDKKTQLSLLLYKGSLMVSPKSTYQTSATHTATQSDIKLANRFDKNSATKAKAKPFLEPQILHEVRTSRYPKYHGINLDLGETSQNVNALLSPRYKKSNPITQAGDEAVQEWKSTLKKTSNSNKTTMFTAEEKPRAKAKGQFNDQTRRVSSPEPAELTFGGIKTFSHGVHTQSPDIPPKRTLKAVATSPERNKPNPILVGEDRPVKPRVVEQQVSEWTQRQSDRKAFLPSERLNSPKRPHLEKPSEIKTIIDQEAAASFLARRTSQGEMHEELRRRKSGTIGNLFDHSCNSDSKFRTATKVNEVEYNTIKSNINTEKTFARTKGDYY